MRIDPRPSAEDFLAVTAAFRGTQPVLTNQLASIAAGVAGGTTYEREAWLVVRDDRGDVVGCAVRTAPWNLVASPMPKAAAAELGRFVAISPDADIPGITGPAEVADALAPHLGSTPRLIMRDLVRVADQLVAPRPTPGSLHRATLTDLDLVDEWFGLFAADVGLHDHGNRALRATIIEAGRVFLWVVDDAPVAMAGHAPVVATPPTTVGRVGPVYTPPENRRLGFGGAATHAVAAMLLETCDTVMLFADAENSDSNSVYARLGFVVAGELVEVALDPVAGAGA